MSHSAPRKRRHRRVLGIGLAVLLFTPLLAGGYLYHAARQAEPIYSGEHTLAGLSSPVAVTFGPHAIPYIRAASQRDLFFAQGYLVASERMWQMDLMRRLARGRLAEVLGEEALPADRLFRTLGLEQAARRNLGVLSEQTRIFLEAYAQGVNAYRDRARGRLPLEYLIARFEPAPWTPTDSLAIAEFMAASLSFNVREEMVYLRLARRLGHALARELFPSDEGVPAPPDAQDLPSYAGSLNDPFSAYLQVATRFGLPGLGPASNAWAITGRHTDSGDPLLANDPHLAPSMPGIWYELELEAPDYHVAGVCLPGLPLVVIGHNADLAWGFTTVMADTQDIFVERVDDEGAVLRTGGASEPIRTRVEEIPVRGWDRPDRHLVRSTSHGVIINDILGERTGTPLDLTTYQTPQLLALRSNLELADPGVDGIYRLNAATSITEARAAARLLTHVSQNALIAHRDGDIGWQVTGALPLRSKGLGTFPAPGWTGDYGWDGYLPRQDNPGLESPPDGLLVNANNRSIPVDHPVHVSRSWMGPYRALRIRELLSAGGRLSPRDLARMQLDRRTIEARRLQDLLRRYEKQLRALAPEAWRIAAAHLLDWDGEMAPDSKPAALFLLLRRALFEAIFGDELGEDLPALLSIAALGYNPLQETIRSGESSFWDDQRTPETEGPAHILARAIHAALDQLEQQSGGVARLANYRSLVFPHAFHDIPLLGRLFDVGPIETGGDDYTVNVAKADARQPDRPIFIPSYRFVFSPGDWGQTRGTSPLGQSGHRFSPYRRDQLADWLDGRTHRWYWGGPPSQAALGKLRLVPTHSPDNN